MVNISALQLDSSADGIDKGHKGDDTIEKASLCKDIPIGPNILKWSRKVVAFVSVLPTTSAT